MLKILLEQFAEHFLKLGVLYHRFVNLKSILLLKRLLLAILHFLTAKHVGHRLFTFDVPTMLIWTYYLLMLACCIQIVWSEHCGSNAEYYTYARRGNLLIIIIVAALDCYGNPALIGTAVIGTVIEVLIELVLHVILLGH